MDDLLSKAIHHLRKVQTEEKNMGNELMSLPWSDDRDSSASRHFYAAEVLEDAIDEIEKQYRGSLAP